MATRPHTLVLVSATGSEHRFEMSRTKAHRAFISSALQGQTATVLSPAGNVLHGYRAEQGPVEVGPNGVLRSIAQEA